MLSVHELCSQEHFAVHHLQSVSLTVICVGKNIRCRRARFGFSGRDLCLREHFTVCELYPGSASVIRALWARLGFSGHDLCLPEHFTVCELYPGSASVIRARKNFTLRALDSGSVSP